MDLRLRLIIQAINRAKSPLKDVKADVEGLEKPLKSVSSLSDKVTGKLKAMAAAVRQAARAAISGGAGSGGVSKEAGVRAVLPTSIRA